MSKKVLKSVFYACCYKPLIHGDFLLHSAIATRLPQWLMVKSPPVNAGHTGLIPGSEDLLEKEMATHFSILAWEIP